MHKRSTTPVVANLQYAGAYRDKLEEAERTGKCPFCKTEFREQALATDGGWFVVNVMEEYRQADREGQRPCHQLLFVPFKHRSDVHFLKPDDFAAIGRLLAVYKKRYRIDGGCLFFRDGNPTHCGRTVRHPHVHYYVPRMVPNPDGSEGFIPVPIDIPAG